MSIFMSPGTWAGYIGKFFVSFLDLIGLNVITFMKIVAIFDVAIGILLFLKKYTKIIAAIAFLHLFSVVISTSALGVYEIAIRDFGLMAAALTLFFLTEKN